MALINEFKSATAVTGSQQQKEKQITTAITDWQSKHY